MINSIRIDNRRTSTKEPRHNAQQKFRQLIVHRWRIDKDTEGCRRRRVSLSLRCQEPQTVVWLLVGLVHDGVVEGVWVLVVEGGLGWGRGSQAVGIASTTEVI